MSLGYCFFSSLLLLGFFVLFCFITLIENCLKTLPKNAKAVSPSSRLGSRLYQSYLVVIYFWPILSLNQYPDITGVHFDPQVVKRRRASGAKFCPVTLFLTNKDHGVTVESGIFVGRIEPGSISSKESGLMVGDRLISVSLKVLYFIFNFFHGNYFFQT